jgi:hypothetical protein
LFTTHAALCEDLRQLQLIDLLDNRPQSPPWHYVSKAASKRYAAVTTDGKNCQDIGHSVLLSSFFTQMLLKQ